MAINHRDPTTIPDNPNYAVSSDEWNADHVLTGGTNGDIVVRDTSVVAGQSLVASAAGVLTCSGPASLPSFQPVGSVILPVIPADKGGTGLATYVVGDLIIANAAVPAATTLAPLADVATGNALISGGVGVVPAYGKIGLTTHITGILSSANGGTGVALFTVAGPTVLRTYTFPDANATILTSSSNTSATFTSFVSIGATPATVGALRLANASLVISRNAANSADRALVGLDGSDIVQLGNTSNAMVLSAATSITASAVPLSGVSSVAIGTTPATVGIIRIPNNQGVFGRNAADSADIALLAIDASNNVMVGGLNINPPVVTLVDGATVALDASSHAPYYRLAAAGDRTLLVPTNPTDGQKIMVQHFASGGSSRTLTLTTGSAGAFRFGTDITTLSVTASGKTDYIGANYNATDSRWDIIAYVKGY